MGWVVRLLAKAATKAAKVDPTDIMNQQAVNDAFHIIKDIVL